MNTESESLNARKIFIFHIFTFSEQLKFRAHLTWAWKKFYNLWTGLKINWNIFGS